MDFQAFVDGFYEMTGVISVEKKVSGGYGDIRIVAVNKKSIDFIENPSEIGIKDMSGNKFVPGSLYDKYLPKDLNFEDVCYRAAALKDTVHTYIRPNRLNSWASVYAMPVNYEDEKNFYCAYTLILDDITNIDIMSTLTADTAADVLKTCIRLQDTTDFKKTMDEVIRDIRIICKSEVCTIMLVDFDSGTCSVLATNIMQGSKLKRVTQFVNFYDIALSWIKTIGDNDCLIIKNEQDMKYISEVNNPWYLTLEEAGVDSVVMFPLKYNGEVLGFIWATNFDTKNTLHIKEILELTTFFISSEIANYKIMKRLEHISYTDLLTGVKNRNAMNNRVSNIVSGNEPMDKNYGIVFADLNGLKRVNDTIGHYAGDLMLKKAAIVLQEVFDGDEIYRAGGDEFMIIVSDCTQTEFSAKVQKLKNCSQDPNKVSFAVGSCYCIAGSDILKAMRISDEDMYKDKGAFYSEKPDMKYR